MSADNRSLAVRVRALAQRFDAVAIGAAKNPRSSLQDMGNAQRDAQTLHDAADALGCTCGRAHNTDCGYHGDRA